MNNNQFAPIARRLAGLIKHDYKLINLKDEYYSGTDFQGNINQFLDGFVDKSHKIDLAILPGKLPQTQFPDFVEESHYPVLSFMYRNGTVCPVILDTMESEGYRAFIYEGSKEHEAHNIAGVFENLVVDADGNVVYAVPYSLHPMVSNNDNQMNKVNGPVSRLFNLLGAERKDILYIYFYAIIISIISLSLPLGIQAIVGLVTGGVIFNSIVLLIAFVIVGILIAGALQVMQYTIVEILQRRIFVKAALEFTYRVPKVRTEALHNSYAPELMNRFFDVLTIQKGLPKLLIDITGAALQIIFGLILLAFYHPFFVFFGITLVAALSVVLYITGPKGLKTSLMESKYKYKVAHWLEEIARTLYSFKLAGHTSLPMQKMDNYVNSYLHYRKKHFRTLMSQFINIVGFKTIVTGGLLVIGTWLVIDRQITLGQFVATELVIVLILAAVEKLILSMSSIYDVLTAVEKIGNVTDLNLEKKEGIVVQKDQEKGMEIKVRNLKFKYPNNSAATLNGLNLDVQAGERICISGYNNSGKNTFAKLLSGFYETYDGVISLNNYSLRDINISSLRDMVAKNVSNEDIFDGTILDNLTMGKTSISYNDVQWALESVGLLDEINALPEGLMTNMVAGGKHFSSSAVIKLTIARAIAEKPQLLIINDVLHELEKKERLQVLKFLTDAKNPWTLVCVTNDPVVMSACERVIVMRDGKSLLTGNYEALLKEKAFQDILIYPYKMDVA